MIRAFIFVLALLSAGAAVAQVTGTPASTVTLAANGTSAPLTIDARQGLPVNLMLAAPGGGLLEVDSAPTATGPWVPIALVQTMAGSNTFDPATNIMSTIWPGYQFTLKSLVPYLRLTATGLTGTATLAVAQPVIQ